MKISTWGIILGLWAAFFQTGPLSANAITDELNGPVAAPRNGEFLQVPVQVSATGSLPIGMVQVAELMDPDRRSTLEKNRVTNKASLTSLAWKALYPDAENFFYTLYGPNKPPNGPNYARFNDPTFNKLYEQIQCMEDTPERVALCKKMNHLVAEQVPAIYIAYGTDIFLKQGWLKNHVMIIPDGSCPEQYWDIDLAEKKERQGKA